MSISKCQLFWIPQKSISNRFIQDSPILIASDINRIDVDGVKERDEVVAHGIVKIVKLVWTRVLDTEIQTRNFYHLIYK